MQCKCLQHLSLLRQIYGPGKDQTSGDIGAGVLSRGLSRQRQRHHYRDCQSDPGAIPHSDETRQPPWQFDRDSKCEPD